MIRKKKKIAFFLPSLQAGGTERVRVLLANRFAALGYDIDIVLSRADGKHGQFIKQLSPATNVVDLGASRLVLALPRLIRYMKRTPPDVMLSGLGNANVIALTAHRIAKSKFRLVITENSYLSIAARSGGIRKRLLPWMMRHTYPGAAAIVAVSRGVRDDLISTIGLTNRRVDVIYNPLDLEHVDSLSVQDFVPKDDTRPLILAAGRLESPKDFPCLIRAFAQLSKKRPARLVILGQGSLRDALEAQVKSLGLAGSISLPGFVENPYAWMKRAELFVLSSAWEGLPNVLIEAMACGTRVVSTDCRAGAAEILEDGKWGRLVPVGDANALAEAMDATLDDPNPPDVRLRAEDFDLNAAADKYLQVLLGTDTFLSD
jgi:glycosyltransferase involved in cell wall biosynthesis